MWSIQSATHGLLRARGWVEVGSNLHAVCREVSYHCSVQGGVLSILHCTALQCQQYICRNVTVVQDDIIFLLRVKGGVEVVKISNIEHKIV